MVSFDGRRNATRKLSDEDKEHLLVFQQRCDLLEDRTISVAQRYQNGLYVVGRPGSGKTHVIREALDRKKALFVYRNGRMTPMGLYEQLALHPEGVIVIDDIPSLLAERMALQILMAALGGEPGQPRPITYSTKSKNERGKAFEFSGGIIAISNVPLRRDALADAIASRSVLLEHEPTDEELRAVMRYTAVSGFEDMNPSECRRVVEFVIDESRANDYRLDLRYMRKGFQDYRQHKHGNASRPWEELIRSSMKQIHRQRPHVVVSKQEQLERQREQVRQAMLKFPGDSKRQIAETGFKPTKFYSLRNVVLTCNGG